MLLKIFLVGGFPHINISILKIKVILYYILMPNSNQGILDSIDNKIAALRIEIEILEQKKAKINRQANQFNNELDRRNQIDLNRIGYKTHKDSLGNTVRTLGKQRVLMKSNEEEVDLGGGRKRKTHKKRRLSRKVKKTYRKRR